MFSIETIWTWAFHCQVVRSFLIIKSNCFSYRSIHIVSFFLSSFCLTIFSSILIYFNWELITLQYYEFFVIHQHESVTSIHVSPHPEIPFPPLSAPYLSGLSQSTALVPCFMYQTCTSILHMVMYMCYSLKSPHPCLLPLSPKVCSLHLCLFCCHACRIVGTFFPNSIYMH